MIYFNIFINNIMPDPVTVGILITLGSLVIERIFKLAMHIKKSQCCGNTVEFDNNYYSPINENDLNKN